MRFMMLMIPRVYQGAKGKKVAPDFAPSADAVQNMTAGRTEYSAVTG